MTVNYITINHLKGPLREVPLISDLIYLMRNLLQAIQRSDVFQCVY